MDILAVLQSQPKTNLPSLQYGEQINDAIITVANILNKCTPKPILLPHTKLAPIDPPEEQIAHCTKCTSIEI